MDKLTLLKFICGKKLKYTYNELHKAQTYYYSLNTEDTIVNFDPLDWLCKHANQFFEKCNVVYLSNNNITPVSVFYEDKCVFHNGLFKQSSLETICRFCIDNTYNEDDLSFDADFYYSIYHESIDKFASLYHLHQTAVTKVNDDTRLFYILYGYWNKLFMVPINGLIYIASEHRLIEKYGTYTNSALYEYFNQENVPKLTFCPYTYAASNYEKLNQLVNLCKTIKCDDDDTNENRLAKHYIRKGCGDKLCTHSFNKWDYLANNHKRIKALMVRDLNGKVIWDIYALTSKNVAYDYLKRATKTKKNNFNNVKFVKEFIDDEYVNASKKLCIENASEYFVTYYVLSKEVRYKTSILSKILTFVKDRTEDTMKQIPLNASRFMIETKCL